MIDRYEVVALFELREDLNVIKDIIWVPSINKHYSRQ